MPANTLGSLFCVGTLSISIPDFKKRIVGATNLFSKTKHVVFYNINLAWRYEAAHFKPIEWTVEARFSTLHKLHSRLNELYPFQVFPHFPEKFGLVNTVNALAKDKDGEIEFLAYRRYMLHAYFRELIEMNNILDATVLVRFLQLREHITQAAKEALATSKARKQTTSKRTNERPKKNT